MDLATCRICLEPMANGLAILVLEKCRHEFHQACILNCVKIVIDGMYCVSCPLCRHFHATGPAPPPASPLPLTKNLCQLQLPATNPATNPAATNPAATNPAPAPPAHPIPMQRPRLALPLALPPVLHQSPTPLPTLTPLPLPLLGDLSLISRTPRPPSPRKTQRHSLRRKERHPRHQQMSCR